MARKSFAFVPAVFAISCASPAYDEEVSNIEEGLIPPQVRPASYSSTAGWKLDKNGTGAFDAGDQSITSAQFVGTNKVPFIGTWGAHACSIERNRVGVYDKSLSTIRIDVNGDGVFTSGVDRSFGVNHETINPADRTVIPISWRLVTGTGCKTVVGLFIYPAVSSQEGKWVINENDDGNLDHFDTKFNFGSNGDLPIAIRSPISDASIAAVWRINEGAFYIDYNGDRHWSHCSIDRCVTGFGGAFTWQPLANSAQPFIGIKSPDNFLHIDFNEDLVWNGDPPDLRLAPYGDPGTAFFGTF